MSTPVSTLVQRTRRRLRDWPMTDVVTASVSSVATTVSVADSSRYFVNEPIELDSEAMIVTSLASGTSLNVIRGAFGSTATSHVNASPVLIRPRFLSVEIVDELNGGLDACFPLIYKEILDTSLTAVTQQYEYTVPNMSSPSEPIPYISGIDIKEPGDLAYREERGWDLRRGATPKIRFRRLPVPAATIRVHGFGPFPHFTGISDNTDAQWMSRWDQLLVEWAVASCLASGEALRVRTDTGAIDAREQATRPGSSMAASQAFLQRFNYLLQKLAMPPLPKNIESIA